MIGLGYGARVRVLSHLTNGGGYRNPGAPNFDEMLEHRGYDAAGSVKSSLLIERLGEGPRNVFLAGLYQLRARALAAILQGFTQPTSGVLAAALLGNRHFLTRATAEAFRGSGTFHLLVISGLHVALIAILFLWLLTRLTRSHVLRYSLVIALLWCYALMVGMQPSITRAVVMITATLIAQLIFRASVGANTLAAALLALLVWQPRDLFNPAFQLSFLTVLMITTGVAPLLSRLKRAGEWQPSETTPYPPSVPAWMKWVAEVLFWNEAAFREEMSRSAIRYRLEKARTARFLSRTRVGRAIQWCLAWAGAAVLTATVVQLGLLPLMVAYFHRVSTISPVANVIEGALVFALMIAGGVYLLTYAMSAWAAPKLAGAVSLLGMATVSASSSLLLWRYASLRVPDYGAASAFVYASYFVPVLVLIIALNEWNPLDQRRKRGGESRKAERVLVSFSSSALVACCLLLVWHPFAHQYERGRLSVTFLDVGQGDAMVISFPQGALMLVDSGGRIPSRPGNEADEAEEVFVEDRLGIGEAAVAPPLWRRGVKRLDLIAATHGHADHTEGFKDLVRCFEVGMAVTGVVPQGDGQFDLFAQAVAGAGVPLRSFMRGDGFELDGVRVEALAPFREAQSALRSGNNESLVLRLSYGQQSFLLTGDIEHEVESQLVAAGDNLRADVLKVAHHGSRTSSTAEFLERVAPRYAVISVASPSPFGHPHAEVLDRLSRAKARVLQTSACGAITISTDGSDLRVETFIRCGGGEQSGGSAWRSSHE